MLSLASVTTPVDWLFSDQSTAGNQDPAGSVDSAGSPAVPAQIGGCANNSIMVQNDQTSMPDDDVDDGSEHDQMVWTDDEQDQPKSQFISIFVIGMSRYRF